MADPEKVNWSEQVQKFAAAELATGLGNVAVLETFKINNLALYVILGIPAGIGATIFTVRLAAKGLDKTHRSLLALRAKVSSPSPEISLRDSSPAPLTDVALSSVD